MASPSLRNHWPRFPDIPIIYDTRDGDGTPLLDGSRERFSAHETTDKTLRVPQHTPNGRPVEFIRVISPIEPGYSFVKVPIPAKAGRSPRLQPRRPTLRSFLDNKVTDSEPSPPRWGQQSNIRNKTQRQRSAAIVQLSLAGSQIPFGGSSFSEKTVQINPDSGCKTAFGLGIVNESSRLHTPLTTRASHERNDSTPDIAQRIEKRLWQYSSSGNVVERWLLEIISWIVSALCMSTIIGILIYFNDKKLPRGPHGLTLNVYIAVLSKIASAALLLPASEALGQLKWSWFQGDSKKMWDFEIFDNASRGPWGSFLLLIRTKAKTLAALGATVTLLSLALDPVFQQLVAFPDRWTLLQGNSSIPKVAMYSPKYDQEFVAGSLQTQLDKELSAVAEKFFYGNGTTPIPFGNGTRADIPLSCPTSNCTWPPYDTLGVCSACMDIDVSQFLNFACLTTRMDWVANLTGPGTEATYPNGTVCGYFLNVTSASPFLMSGYRVENGTSAGEALMMRTLPLITNPSRRALFGGSINFKNVRNPIADVLIVSAAGGSETVYRNVTPIAHECVVSWCVKTIKSSYYWASYKEEIVEQFVNTTAGPYPWKFFNATNDAGEPSVVLRYTQNVTLNVPSIGKNSSGYGVSNVTAATTATVFDQFFPSFLTVASPLADPFLRFNVRIRGPPFSKSLEVNPWLAPNNVTNHMEKLATALTNVIRSSSSKEWVLGTASSTETYVAVRWGWLSFPLGVLFLSLIFLIATIIKSSREKDHVGVWKTSAIATLLYGLPDDLQTKIKSSTSAGTPRSKAKGLKVKLLPKGWRVSGNLFSPTVPRVNKYHPPPGWI